MRKKLLWCVKVLVCFFVGHSIDNVYTTPIVCNRCGAQLNGCLVDWDELFGAAIY